MDERELRELIGPEPTPAPAPTQRFKPWHRPRKQFIRARQWCLMLRKLLTELEGVGHSRTVKYLGLPGEDLLDVRVFHDLMTEFGEDWFIRFLGFNGAATPEEVLSESITHDLPRLRSDLSKYLRHPLESVANGSGPGGRAMKEFGGFDVVNIDLCDAIRPPGAGNGVLDALRAIVTHQLDHRAEPWLLFLTTRIDSPSLDRVAHAAFLERIVQNVSGSDDFAGLLESEMRIERGHLEHMLNDLRTEEAAHPPTAPSTVGLGIAKWLLGLLTEQACGLTMGPCYMYGIGGDAPNMAALAFSFKRHASFLTDPSGLTADSSPVLLNRSEEAVACRMVKPLARMKNIDELMSVDVTIKIQCIEDSAALLGRAGHDRDAYRRWAAGFPS